MNLADIFAWVGPLDHKVKLAGIYLKISCRIIFSEAERLILPKLLLAAR